MDPALIAEGPAPLPEPVLRVAHLVDVAHVGTTLVAGLRAAGIAADLVDPPRPGAGGSAIGRYLGALPRLGCLLATVPGLRRGHYDLVHVHGAWRGGIAMLAGRPFVVHIHGTDLLAHRGIGIRARLTRQALTRARAVYCATPDLLPLARGFRPDARFLPNPVDTASFVPASGGVRRDVLVGVRLTPVKGLGTIVAVLRELRRIRPATTVTIVDQGAGVGEVRSAAGAPAALIPSRPHDEMPSLYRQHRLAIGQWRSRAIGNYELEALASGLPVAAAFGMPAAYDVPPPLIDGASPEAVAARIAAVLDDDEGLAAAGEAGRSWVLAHHRSETIAARLAADYRELLGGPAVRS